MNYGFIKVAAATPEIQVANCEFNAEQIISAAKRAAAGGADIVVMPELCITGYTCDDLFFQKAMLDSAKSALCRIAEKSCEFPDTIVIVGLPLSLKNSLYNCAAVILNGDILGIVPKVNIPNYNEFYEKRHFCPAPCQSDSVFICGKNVPFYSKLLFRHRVNADFCFGIEICEDLWVDCPPSVMHTRAGATIIANLSSSNEIIGKAEYRRILVSSQSARALCGYIYANSGNGESTGDLVFSGHSIIAENGIILEQTELFENGIALTEIDVERLAGERRKCRAGAEAQCPTGYETIYFDLNYDKDAALKRKICASPFIPEDDGILKRRCREILDLQTAGLAKRVKHINAKTLVIGVSGGLDSALALLVCVRVMDMLGRARRDVIAITMPCFGTTARTKTNAEKLCRALGVSFREIDITNSVNCHFSDIGHDQSIRDYVYENSQARERTQVLMDIANKYGGIVIGTGDLSEAALGWETYNGDHMSMYAVNCSVPKTMLRHIVRYAADNDADIRETLLDILDTPVSPELIPSGNGEISQKTEDLVGPYELHDFFIYYMLRFGFAPDKIYYLAKNAFNEKYDNKTILKWLKVFYKRFFAQQFKRSCMPDGPKIGTISLSPRGDWRMPSDACANIWLALVERLN